VDAGGGGVLGVDLVAVQEDEISENPYYCTDIFPKKTDLKKQGLSRLKGEASLHIRFVILYLKEII